MFIKGFISGEVALFAWNNNRFTNNIIDDLVQ